MEDHKIIDLYWARSQQAIVESDQKYGPYCRAIALGILAMRRTLRSASTTPGSGRGTLCRHSAPRCCLPSSAS